MKIDYKVVETKIEGDWGIQLIEMPYEVFQLISNEFEEENSDFQVRNTVVCNPEIPPSFTWVTCDKFIDPNNPEKDWISPSEVPVGEVVTMILTITNSTTL